MMQSFITYEADGTEGMETFFAIGVPNKQKFTALVAASLNPGVVVAVAGDNLTGESQNRIINAVAVGGRLMTYDS